ncbi:MAG: hypothetical protein H3C48_10570 [Chitinophagaceae bacterium]|nr:hypothetical protein [Chitinophagaceae bacterium]
MNQKNYDYLKDQVKFTGFGDSLENELMEKIKQQLPEFTLQHQREFGKDNITATLHFKKPENSEVYFFNRYDLSVNQPNNEAAVNQTFFIGRENNFTLKEAYNMLAGRAVYKELNKLEKIGEGNTAYYQPTDEKYKAWVQLDFKNTEDNGNFKMKYFHDNYGFDLKAKLAEYPIKELNNEEERKNLLQSLEKGNRQSVTFIRDGKEQKQFIEASPQYKSINIYDSNNKRVRKTQKQDEDTSRQTQEKSKKQKQEQSPDEESGPGKAAKRSRKAKQGIS